MSERYEGEPDACWLCGDTDMHPLIACPSGNYLCADCCGPEEACFVCGQPRDGHVHTLTVDDDAPRRPRLESGSWQWSSTDPEPYESAECGGPLYVRREPGERRCTALDALGREPA